MATPSLKILQAGTEDPPPETRELSAGPLSLRYEDGALRHIRFGTREVVRRVSFALRDPGWNAVPFRCGGLAVEGTEAGFSLSFLAESARADLPLRFRAWIQGARTGSLSYAVEAETPGPLSVTRLGLSVLLPIKDLMGRPCLFERGNGSILKGSFPRYVQPHPFADAIRALAYEVSPGVRARLVLEGETFELEDLRNWTDASFELYTPSARIPLPLQVPAGTAIRQSFTLSIEGPTSVSRIDPASTAVSVGSVPGALLPRLGLGSAGHGRALGPQELRRLKLLGPAHLRVDVNPSDPAAAGLLRRSAAEARAVGCGLELALHLDERSAGDLKSFVALMGPLNLPVSRWILYKAAEPVPPERFLAAARETLIPFRPEASLAAGSDAHFSDLNRNRVPKAAELLAFSASPQVHGRDTGTFVENLEGLASAIESARLLPGDRPIVLSPLTLRPRFNPNAPAAAADAAADELPSKVDPRQLSLLGAAWTAGALRAVAQAGVQSVTFYETSGRQGVMERDVDPTPHPRFPSLPGAVFPLYHVLADAMEMAGAAVLPWTLGRDLVVDGVGLVKGPRVRVLLANLTGTNQKVRLACPLFRGPVRMRVLDETNVLETMRNPEAFRQAPGAEIDPQDRPVELELLPYAVVRLDA
jgi:hypothetical protein